MPPDAQDSPDVANEPSPASVMMIVEAHTGAHSACLNDHRGCRVTVQTPLEERSCGPTEAMEPIRNLFAEVGRIYDEARQATTEAARQAYAEVLRRRYGIQFISEGDALDASHDASA